MNGFDLMICSDIEMARGVPTRCADHQPFMTVDSYIVSILSAFVIVK